jgi:hypothetical protein
MPVEKTWCHTCEATAPRISIMGFSAVICPDCQRVYVDERK